METLIKIASKAEYIHDVASVMLAENESLDTVLAYEILRQLENIADALDEHHDWGCVD